MDRTTLSGQLRALYRLRDQGNTEVNVSMFILVVEAILAAEPVAPPVEAEWTHQDSLDCEADMEIDLKNMGSISGSCYHAGYRACLRRNGRVPARQVTDEMIETMCIVWAGSLRKWEVTQPAHRQYMKELSGKMLRAALSVKQES